MEDRTDKPEPEDVMRTVRERVEEKRRRGVYDRYNLKEIEALEAETLKADDGDPERYLRDIWITADIDLGDFEIQNKGGVLGLPAVWLKKIIWKLLKFYTFRLFSQQKNFNTRTAFILQEMNRKFEERIKALEEGNRE